MQFGGLRPQASAWVACASSRVRLMADLSSVAYMLCGPTAKGRHPGPSEPFFFKSGIPLIPRPQ